MMLFLVVKLILLFAILELSSSSEHCAKEFRTRGYIPKFADEVKYTSIEVETDHKVQCGEVVPYLQTLECPTIKYDVGNRCKNVTILVFVPDAIVAAPYPLLLAVNVPSSALKTGFKDGGQIFDNLGGSPKGDIIAQYVAPTDPTGGSVHKQTVAYFIYCQCHYNSDLRAYTRIDRVNFDVKTYAKEHNLPCPLAGFFHQISFTGLPITDLPVEVPPVPIPVTVPNPKLPLPAS